MHVRVVNSYEAACQITYSYVNKRQVLNNGSVYYMYANGFHSVHAHGINLGLPFKLNKKDDVFLLDDVNNMNISDQLVELLTKTEN